MRLTTRPYARTWTAAALLCAVTVGAYADYGTDQTGYAASGRYDLIEKQVEAMAKQGPLRTRDQHALCFAYSKLKRYERLMPCLDQLQAHPHFWPGRCNARHPPDAR